MGWFDAVVEAAGDAGEAIGDFGSSVGKNIYDTGSSAFDKTSNLLSNAGDSMEKTADDYTSRLRKYYLMDQSREDFEKGIDTKGVDKWTMVGSGKEMSEKELEDLKKRMSEAGVAMPTKESVTAERLANYDAEAADKRIRRMITGGLLGGALGALKHKADGGRKITAGSISGGGGGGRLGTGYDPLKNRVFSGR